jgi:formate hydrogenlyase subunit 5
MNKIDIDIKDIFSGKIGFSKVVEHENQVFIKVRQEELDKTIMLFSEKDFVLVSLFCEQHFENNEFTLFYAFEKLGHNTLVVILVNINLPVVNSISKIFPSASWYEREISDGFGIVFENSPDDRRLFLHEIYPKDFHPLLKSFRNKKMNLQQKNDLDKVSAEYKFREIEGEGVYQIPVGPIHAGIIEPGHFRFSVIGESVFNLEIRMFYTHRGIEKLSEEKNPEDVVNIAESISGYETMANAVGFCNAIEQLSAEKIPERAIFLRTLLLEMERIYSHLGDLGGMCVDVAYPKGASPFFILREEALRNNYALTGSRFMKGIVCIGGLTKNIEKKKLRNLDAFLNKLLLKLRDAVQSIYGSSAVEERFETTGIIKHELIKHLNLTGPTARASGSLKDIRQDCSYGAYKKIGISIKTKSAGDVQSRFNVKVEEIIESIRIIRKIIWELPSGEIKKDIILKDGFIISMIEAPRGQNLHYVHLKNGAIQRYKIRTASFCNWQAIEHAVLGNIVPDFPLINKSLNLSYAGTDL